MINYIKEFIIFSIYKLNSFRTLFFSKVSPENEKCLKGLYDNGIFHLPSQIEPTKVTELKSCIDDLLENQSQNVNIWNDPEGADSRIYGANQLNTKFKELIPFNFIKNIGELYLQTSLEEYFILAAKISYKEGNIGSGGGWHRDSAHSHQFKSIMYLSDVNEKSGPFQYIPKSHKTFFKIKLPFNLSKTRFSVEEINILNESILECTAKAGDIILTDTKGLHRGKPLDSGFRYALTVYFFTNKKQKKNFETLLQKKN